MHVTKKNLKIRKKKGVALLLAVLISSLALSASLGVFALLFDQLAFAGTAHESVTAFFAANAAAECVYFSRYISKISFNVGDLVACNGGAVGAVEGDNGGERQFSFDVEYIGGRKVCAEVSVYPGSRAGSNTFIMRGSNVSCLSLPGSINAIQRVIETRDL